MDVTPGPIESDAVEARLRLKRIFLRSLIISLVACAAIAVAALLFGKFGRTTVRILGTLGVLAAHSAVALACAESLDRRWWPTLSRIGLVVFTVNFAWFELIVWGHDTWVGQETGTTFALIAYYVGAIVPFILLARRQWRVFAAATLAVIPISLTFVLSMIWFDREMPEFWERCTVVSMVLAASAVHTCLLGLWPTRGGGVWVLRGTIACIWALAALGSYAILFDVEDQLMARFIGALGVLDGCGTLCLLILARLSKVRYVERLESTAKQIELICPRCAKQQKLTSGAAECVDCGLRLRIEIEEPRCAGCGYLLWQLTERRCPECGREF